MTRTSENIFHKMTGSSYTPLFLSVSKGRNITFLLVIQHILMVDTVQCFLHTTLNAKKNNKLHFHGSHEKYFHLSRIIVSVLGSYYGLFFHAHRRHP